MKTPPPEVEAEFDAWLDEYERAWRTELLNQASPSIRAESSISNAECRPGQTAAQTRCTPRPRVLGAGAGGSKTCKECSAVAIQALTGNPVADVKRTLPETVFMIEDMGYARDTSPTNAWRGKTVDEFARSANYPLALVHVKETTEHEAHVMPMVNGNLMNRAAWHTEPIATVIAFTPKSLQPPASASTHPPLKVLPSGVREMPSRDHPAVKMVSAGELDAFSRLAPDDVPGPIGRVAKALGWEPDRTGYVLRRAVAEGRVSGRTAEVLTGDPDELAYTYRNAEGELIGRVVRKK